MNSIIKALNKCKTIDDYYATLEGILEHNNNLITQAIFQEHKYTRIRIHQCNSFELLLICWSPNQSSSYHDHGKSECLMSCISGELQEITSQKNIEEKTNMIPNYISHISNKECHKIKNVSATNAISLHLYIPPITRCNVFNKISSNHPQQVKLEPDFFMPKEEAYNEK
tara:strand:+ start:366 stop:872 length:507 start_codon:yes stop_codon:yes gene_type:complete